MIHIIAPASLGYPLSVFNENSTETLKEKSPGIYRISQACTEFSPSFFTFSEMGRLRHPTSNRTSNSSPIPDLKGETSDFGESDQPKGAKRHKICGASSPSPMARGGSTSPISGLSGCWGHNKSQWPKRLSRTVAKPINGRPASVWRQSTMFVGWQWPGVKTIYYVCGLGYRGILGLTNPKNQASLTTQERSAQS